VPADVEPWEAKADCRKEIIVNPFLDAAWVDETGPFKGAARKICLSCPVRAICLQDALDDEEAEGMRGGYWFEGGKIPVGEAREIQETMGLIIRPHQSTGRAKK
jgi:hypothetical protein